LPLLLIEFCKLANILALVCLLNRSNYCLRKASDHHIFEMNFWRTLKTISFMYCLKCGSDYGW
jgi:hypothetical protein